jgi:V/A-type H+-transporting ATPase subunit D
MPRLLLTKASLTKQKSLLKTYASILPSLDLKRKQLSAELEAARKSLEKNLQMAEDLMTGIGHRIPMLANTRVEVEHLVKIRNVQLVEENLLGTVVPRVASIDVDIQPYGLLTKPFWVDGLIDLLRQALEMEVQAQVNRRRVELIREAMKKVTQRYNLFDQILIPSTKTNIRRISIYLADAERAAVVNSKIAKKKKLKEKESQRQES